MLSKVMLSGEAVQWHRAL